jgi:transglutaminase-like putative cysteine protease
MPEMGGVQRAKVERLPDPARPVAVLGTPRQARSYRVTLQALAMTLDVLIDVETHEALRYEVPAQDLVVEPAPERMVDRLERADLTSAIVTKTNLDIEDPSVLTSMKVRATIECTPDVTLEGLSVPGQRFDGKVEKGVVEGVFEIRPRRSDGSGATPWPIPPGAFSAEGLRPYLAAEEGIESDDPAIGAKARELASGASTCFEVVDRLGAWIGEHVRYEIPGGFTARRVFETGKGECGGHSHLMAAMLRSLGIPARTPMGGMYIPLHGGSFGQHMWNEVYLGAAIGWLPIDVTAGQRTFVDAGHIRLMAGVTRFRPRSIEVLAYEPREAAASRPVDRATGPYPFTVGETLVYAVSVKGQAIGEDRVTYRGRQGAGHLFEGTTSLGGGHLVETTWTTVGDDGRLISFRCERKAGQDASAIEVARDGANAVITTTTSEGRNSASVGANLDVFPLHNNCTAHFAIPLSRITVKEGEETRIRFLHDEQKAAFWMTLRGRAPEELTMGDKTVVARVVAGSLLSLEMTFHLDERGRLLRFAQTIGDVVIELKAP